MKLVTVALDDLTSSPINPPRRTSETALRDLITNIKRYSLQTPILITKDHVIIDGHRRVAALRALGQTTVPAIITDANPQHGFVAVNGPGGKRNMSAGEWDDVARLGGGDYLPRKNKLLIAKLITYIGILEAERWMSEGTSSGIAGVIRLVLDYCNIAEDDPRVHEIAVGVRRNQHHARAMLKLSIPADAVVQVLTTGCSIEEAMNLTRK